MIIYLVFIISNIYCQYDKKWDAHKQQYNLKLSLEEDTHRYKIFVQNMKKIQTHNSNPLNTFKMKINQFGHLTNDEYKNFLRSKVKLDYKLLNTDNKPSKANYKSNFKTSRIDWREKNVVTPIKDQGSCGSCYAFSAIGVVESAYAINYGKLYNLSVEQVVQCDYSNHGCGGGYAVSVMYYLFNKGIERWEDYPFNAESSGLCKYDEKKVLFRVKGYKYINQNEYALTYAIKTIGPVSVAIDASHDSFKFYSEGIYMEPNCSKSQLDHSVILVGYDQDEQQNPYYILKNSWNTTWGINGYMHIARNGNNTCGLATSAMYPIV